MYLPRGVAHAATAGDQGSVHLSLALIPPRGADLLRLLEELAERTAFFQEYVPFSFGAGDDKKRAYARRFRENLIETIERADFFELLDQRHRARSTAAAGQRLTALFDVVTVNSATRVRVRTGLRYDVSFDRKTDMCRLSFESMRLGFPGLWHTALEALRTKPEFAASELGETLPIAGNERIQAIGNLLRAGFLEIVPE